MEIIVESHCALGIKIHQSSEAEENNFHDIHMLLYFIIKFNLGLVWALFVGKFVSSNPYNIPKLR